MVGDTHLRGFHLPSQTFLLSENCHTAVVRSVAILPNSSRVITGDYDGRVKVSLRGPALYRHLGSFSGVGPHL